MWLVHSYFIFWRMCKIYLVQKIKSIWCILFIISFYSINVSICLRRWERKSLRWAGNISCYYRYGSRRGSIPFGQHHQLWWIYRFKAARKTNQEKQDRTKRRSWKGGETENRHIVHTRAMIKPCFFFFIYEKQLSVRAACKMVKIPPSTGQNWYKKGLESLEKEEDLPHVKEKNEAGRPPKL